MPVLNLPLTQLRNGNAERNTPLLSTNQVDENDNGTATGVAKLPTETHRQSQHSQQPQTQQIHQQFTESPNRNTCIAQCQSLFSLPTEDDDQGNHDCNVDNNPLFTACSSNSMELKQKSVPASMPLQPPLSSPPADSASPNNTFESPHDYHSILAEWPLQHLAMLEQLETEYDQALQEIKLDLKAKLCWIRYSAMYSVFFVMVYLLVGMLFFRHVTDWTLAQAMLFAVYTMTSAGYGCYKTPRTNVFQLFQVFYIMIGIAALAIMVAQVFQYVAFETSLAQQAMDKPELARRGLDLLSQPTAGQTMISEDRRSTLQSVINVYQRSVPQAALALFQMWNQAKTFFRTTPTGRTLSVILPLLLILLSGGLIVGTIEQWTLMESIYFAVVSMTTVGYGDYYPTHTSSTVITILWLPWSIVFLSIYMGSVASWYLDLSSRTMKRIESAMRRQMQRQSRQQQQQKASSITLHPSSSGCRLAEALKETPGTPNKASPSISEASSSDDLAVVPSSELFGAPGTQGGSGTLRRESILLLKTVAQQNPWTHDGQAMPTMADVLRTTHEKLEALASRRATEASGTGAAETLDEQAMRPTGAAVEFFNLRPSPSMVDLASNTSRPPLELRLLVLERLAAIIASEVTGISSSIEIKQDTLSITFNNLKQIAQKWLVPRRALKAFRSVAFECLYFIGEHAMITRGAAALLDLSPMEFHKLFHPLLAAMGDAETLETWLASTEIMADQRLRISFINTDGATADTTTTINGSNSFPASNYNNNNNNTPYSTPKRTHQKFTVQDNIANLPLPFQSPLR